MKHCFMYLALAITTALVFVGCSDTSVSETSSTSTYQTFATPTPIPYVQTSYYDSTPAISGISFGDAPVQDVGGQEMPVFSNGDEITVSLTTSEITSDLIFNLEAIPYDLSYEANNPVPESITVSYENGGYEVSFTDNNESLVGYYMSFNDPENGNILFDAMVACGDISVIE